MERQTGIPKAYGVVGIVALYFFFIILNLGGQLLTNIAGFAIPAYYSTAALFSANKEDDTQWLTVSSLSQNLTASLCYENRANFWSCSTGSSLLSSRTLARI